MLSSVLVIQLVLVIHTSRLQVPGPETEIKMPLRALPMMRPEMTEIKMSFTCLCAQLEGMESEMPDIGFTFEDFSALVVEKLPLTPFSRDWKISSCRILKLRSLISLRSAACSC